MDQSQTDTYVPVYMESETNQNLSPIYTAYTNTGISSFNFEPNYTNYTNSSSSQPLIQSEPIPEVHTQTVNTPPRGVQVLLVLMVIIIGALIGFSIFGKKLIG